MFRYVKMLEIVKELMEVFLVYDWEKKGIVFCLDFR